MGWPYTYYDGVRKLRLISPEYGGDGKTSPVDGNYATPVAAFFKHRRPAVLDLAFYSGKQFLSMYRGDCHRSAVVFAVAPIRSSRAS
jgi:glucose/arabinose dehydrogenase